MIKSLLFYPAKWCQQWKMKYLQLCSLICYVPQWNYWKRGTFSWILNTALCLASFCGNFPPIYSINLLLPIQQQAFPHQYLRSRPCFARTMCFKLHVYFFMVLMQMCNPKIDNLDRMKMKGQLKLVLRIEHCSILNTVSWDLKNLIIHCI
jgi:hypothetical protein